MSLLIDQNRLKELDLLKLESMRMSGLVKCSLMIILGNDPEKSHRNLNFSINDHFNNLNNLYY